MMKLGEIKAWYKDVKEDYNTWVNDNDMPEGDFNVLESEYELLRTILGYDERE